jgi:hypothetical protein
VMPSMLRLDVEAQTETSKVVIVIEQNMFQRPVCRAVTHPRIFTFGYACDRLEDGHRMTRR